MPKIEGSSGRRVGYESPTLVRRSAEKGRFVTVTGTGDLAASLIRALAADGVQVSELEATHGNLGDAFIRLTRDTTSAAPEEARA